MELMFAGLGGLWAGSIFPSCRGGCSNPEGNLGLEPKGKGNGLNLLLILVDQMRSLIWFSPGMTLPNFEKLRETSLDFTQHFTSAVPCSPSRASLFTGLHSIVHRVFSNVGEDKSQADLSTRLVTLGKVFQHAGYQTPYFGRWNLSQAKPDLGDYGFMRMFREYGGAKQEPGLEYDRLCVDAACSWLASKNAAQKWLLTISLINPHDIVRYKKLKLEVPELIAAPPANWNDFLENKPSIQKDWSRKDGPEDVRQVKDYLNLYYYYHQQMDRELGRILDALAGSGCAQNTIIVFTSDHGDLAGSHRLFLKGPCVYDEQNHIPLLIHHPDYRPRAVPALSSNVDLFPTLASLAGLQLVSSEPLPGLDLAPIIRGESLKLGDRQIQFFYRWGHYSKQGSPFHIDAVRGSNFVKARYFNTKDPAGAQYEQYDLRLDPLQMNNLARNLPD